MVVAAAFLAGAICALAALVAWIVWYLWHHPLFP